MQSIAFPALCTGLYKFPTTIVSRIIFDEVLQFSRHDTKHVLNDIRLIDISEGRAKLLAKEFDARDFNSDGQRKSILEEQENLLSNELHVSVSEEGEGE